MLALLFQSVETVISVPNHAILLNVMPHNLEGTEALLKQTKQVFAYKNIHSHTNETSNLDLLTQKNHPLVTSLSKKHGNKIDSENVQKSQTAYIGTLTVGSLRAEISARSRGKLPRRTLFDRCVIKRLTTNAQRKHLIEFTLLFQHIIKFIGTAQP